MVEEIVAGLVVAAVPGFPSLLYFISREHPRSWDRIMDASFLRSMLMAIQFLWLGIGIFAGRNIPDQYASVAQIMVWTTFGILAAYFAVSLFIEWLHSENN